MGDSGKRRSRRPALLTLGAPIALLLALVYSQVGWRADRAQYFLLRDAVVALREKGRFPQDGDALAASGMRVLVDQTDAVPLQLLLPQTGGMVYFERSDCPICGRFAQAMDSLLPTWRDSLVIVSPFSDTGRGRGRPPRLDSLSSAMLTGVPALLVVDSAGVVRHSVRAGLPAMIAVLEFVGFPAPRQMLTEKADQVATTR